MSWLRRILIKKNDFEKMCDKLEECNSYCKCNPIICVKRHLGAYVGNDFNLLLKIKAEIPETPYQAYVSNLFSMTAFAVSSFGLFLTILGDPKDFSFGIIILCTFILILILLLNGICAFRNVRKWSGYLRISIEEMEKEFN